MTFIYSFKRIISGSTLAILSLAALMTLGFTGIASATGHHPGQSSSAPVSQVTQR